MLARLHLLPRTALWAAAIVSAHVALAASSQHGISFPDDPAVINVARPPYGAKGEGVADDTVALQKRQ